MNTKRNRISSALLVLLVLLLSAFPVYCEGGDGSGGGQDKPLTLAESSIQDGAKNVDPNAHIVLTFTKNVVNFVVRENNLKCFYLKDSSGNAVPIRVEMGDDQVDPDIKRIVTVVPRSPLTDGESYVLTISRELAAKNGRDKLDEDVSLHFTVRQTTDPHAVIPPAANTTTTTTTKRAEETSTKRVTTTRPPITAAVRTSTTASGTTTQNTASATLPDAARFPESTNRTAEAAQTSAVSSSMTLTATTTTTLPAETVSDPEPQTELNTTGYTTSFTATQTVSESEQPQEETESAEAAVETQKHKSPTLLIGIMIVLAAAAAAVIIIMQNRKKERMIQP